VVINSKRQAQFFFVIFLFLGCVQYGFPFFSLRVPHSLFCLLNVYANIYISEVWPNDKIFDFNTNTNGQNTKAEAVAKKKGRRTVSAGKEAAIAISTHLIDGANGGLFIFLF